MQEKTVTTDTFLFEGKTYKTWWIFYKDYHYCFATTELEDQLLDSYGNYKSNQARLIDEGIVYFLDEKERMNVTYQSLLRYAELII